MQRQTHDPLALVRVPAKTAAEVCAYASLGPAALGLLEPEQTPRAYLDRLLELKKFPEAIRFLAFALPRREAVWWGCLSVMQAAGPHLPAPQVRALQAATRWVLEPSETHRHEAEQVAGLDTAAGCMARAVAWSGGSMSPPELPAVPPPPILSHRAVDAGVTLAIVQGTNGTLEDRFRHTLALGVHIARGHYLWVAPHGGAAPH